MLEFIRQSVPFFPRGSAVEIYSKFRETVHHTQGHECYEAVAWLAILLPTTELEEGGDHWDAWFAEWMDLFESNSGSEFWNFWWLSLFTNVAKDDTKGKADKPTQSGSIALRKVVASHGSISLVSLIE